MKISVNLMPLFDFLPEESIRKVLPTLVSQLQPTGIASLGIPLTVPLLEIFPEDWFRFLRQGIFTYTMLYLPPEEDLIKAALRIRPEMIVICDREQGQSVIPDPIVGEVDESRLKELKQLLDAHRISLGMWTVPHGRFRKKVQKLPLDWLDISASDLLESEDNRELILKMEDYSNLALLARKLGIGVSISGDFSLIDLKWIHDIHNVEEVIFHRTFLENSLLFGVQKTVEMIRAHLRE